MLLLYKSCCFVGGTAGKPATVSPHYFMAQRPKTFVYVDGYNLYYRAVRDTPYKWLNIQQLCEQVLPDNDVVKIKYFTADMHSRVDPQKRVRQEIFFRALRTLPKLEIIKGKYVTYKVRREVAQPGWRNRLRRWLGQPAGMNPTVSVYDPKEKRSDVNLAVHLLNDAWHNRYDVAVVLSNDSDQLEAMRVVRHERGKAIGIINPHNYPNLELYKLANFKVELRPVMLAAAQFPSTIPGTTIHKPTSW